MEDISWNWIRSFIAVARGGSLTIASDISKSSIPTLSRHIQRLEGYVGERLFVRGPDGYRLNAKGRAFLAKATAMEGAFSSIKEETDLVQNVRISAGHWTARALNRALARMDVRNLVWRPIIASRVEHDDIARGDTDLGVRNQVAKSALLATRTIGEIRFGIYAARGAVEGEFIGAERPISPSAIWVEQHGHVVHRVREIPLALDYLHAGHGQMVLPRFIGDNIEGVEFRGAVDELTNPQILTMHHENRHRPHIRAAIDDITPILQELAAY